MNQFNMNHMRTLVNLAFTHVEKLRAQKATLEQVDFVPNVRPTDLFYPDQCIMIIQSLLKEKQAIESWHKVGHKEVEIGHDAFAKLSEDMRVFDVSLMQTAHDGTTSIEVFERKGRDQ